MAQITEKRVITTQGRTHTSNHGHTHSNATLTRTKENSSTNGNKTQVCNRKGVEILDFHESWLEEVELYKDKLIECKQYPHHQHHHYQQQSSQQQQQQQQHMQQGHLLNTQNNLHTPHGCQMEGTPKARNSARNSTNGVGHVRNSNDKQQTSNSGPTKQRNIVRNAPKTANGSVATLQQAEPYKKVQRAREDSYVKHASNSKKPNTATAAASHHSQSPVKTGVSGSGAGGGGIGHATMANGKNTNALTSGISNTGNGALSSTSTKSASNKIVVNTFHASNLLTAQQLENDKTNFLTQNGLTKSAATALETSLYASMYTAQPQVQPHLNGVRQQSGENTGYTGVTLHKAVLEAEKQRHMINQNSNNQAEDDPCAAIDDVNNYDDSDSEEDYIGSPFYLEEDGTDIRQSRNIRLQLDDDDRLSHMSVGTNDTEASVYFKPTAILSPSLFPNVPPYLNFTSHADKGPPMPTTLHRVLKWKLSPVMPKIVKRVVLNSGFRIIKNTTDWMAVWEKHMKSPGFRTIRSHQKYNHIPGSFRIGRKDTMWRSIHNNMKKFGKKEFGFMQKSYIMPDDLENLRQVWPKNASKLAKWIVKPPASARGTGIRIVNKWSQFPKDRPLVVQKYIERPLLINDNKFDMRLYVVLTSVNPLRIYIYKDGLARFASVKYSSELSNLDERCMHLTNYSINKFSQNYTKNEDFNACQGHKWTLQSLWSCLENRGVNTKRLWATLRNLIIKAIVSGESGLNRMYRQNVNFRYNCFELFGFDVLLDENLVPWLLEINISPSLHSELPLDLHVKGPLIQAVLNTALYQVPPKLTEKQQRDILDDLNLQGPLCHDKRIFTTCLTAEEVRKHNQYTNRYIEYREEYVDTILDNLLPDDVRCLIVAEDEFARCKPLERIFPTADTYTYLRFVENPRYYNRLLDAWENKYGQDRSKGIALLRKLCQEGYHLQVSDAALEKEPNVALTEIDMLHVKKEDPLDNITNISTIVNSIVIGDTGTSTISQENAFKWNTDSKSVANNGSAESQTRPA